MSCNVSRVIYWNTALKKKINEDERTKSISCQKTILTHTVYITEPAKGYIVTSWRQLYEKQNFYSLRLSNDFTGIGWML